MSAMNEEDKLNFDSEMTETNFANDFLSSSPVRGEMGKPVAFEDDARETGSSSQSPDSCSPCPNEDDQRFSAVWTNGQLTKQNGRKEGDSGFISPAGPGVNTNGHGALDNVNNFYEANFHPKLNQTTSNDYESIKTPSVGTEPDDKILDSSLESENGYVNGEDDDAHIEHEGGYKSLQIESQPFDEADNSFVPAAFSNEKLLNFQPIEKMETNEELIQTTINNENFSLESEEPISMTNEISDNLSEMEKVNVNPFDTTNEEEKDNFIQQEEKEEEYSYQVSQEDGCTQQIEVQQDVHYPQEEERSTEKVEESFTPQIDEPFTSQNEETIIPPPQVEESYSPEVEETFTPQTEETCTQQIGETLEVEEPYSTHHDEVNIALPQAEESLTSQEENLETDESCVPLVQDSSPHQEESLVSGEIEGFIPQDEAYEKPEESSIQYPKEVLPSSDEEDDIEERDQEKEVTSDEEEEEQPYEKLSEEKSLTQDVEMNSVEMQQDLINTEPPASSELVHLNMEEHKLDFKMQEPNEDLSENNFQPQLGETEMDNQMDGEIMPKMDDKNELQPDQQFDLDDKKSCELKEDFFDKEMDHHEITSSIEETVTKPDMTFEMNSALTEENIEAPSQETEIKEQEEEPSAFQEEVRFVPRNFENEFECEEAQSEEKASEEQHEIEQPDEVIAESDQKLMDVAEFDDDKIKDDTMISSYEKEKEVSDEEEKDEVECFKVEKLDDIVADEDSSICEQTKAVIEPEMTKIEEAFVATEEPQIEQNFVEEKQEEGASADLDQDQAEDENVVQDSNQENSEIIMEQVLEKNDEDKDSTLQDLVVAEEKPTEHVKENCIEQSELQDDLICNSVPVYPVEESREVSNASYEQENSDFQQEEEQEPLVGSQQEMNVTEGEAEEEKADPVDSEVLENSEVVEDPTFEEREMTPEAEARPLFEPIEPTPQEEDPQKTVESFEVEVTSTENYEIKDQEEKESFGFESTAEASREELDLVNNAPADATSIETTNDYQPPSNDSVTNDTKCDDTKPLEDQPQIEETKNVEKKVSDAAVAATAIAATATAATVAVAAKSVVGSVKKSTKPTTLPLTKTTPKTSSKPAPAPAASSRTALTKPRAPAAANKPAPASSRPTPSTRTTTAKPLTKPSTGPPKPSTNVAARSTARTASTRPTTAPVTNTSRPPLTQRTPRPATATTRPTRAAVQEPKPTSSTPKPTAIRMKFTPRPTSTSRLREASAARVKAELKASTPTSKPQTPTARTPISSRSTPTSAAPPRKTPTRPGAASASSKELANTPFAKRQARLRAQSAKREEKSIAAAANGQSEN